MSLYFLDTAGNRLPSAMILTISISVAAVLLLAGFVLYMWRTQEKSAYIAREVQRITDSIGAGVVNFIAAGDGHIVYASKGFYEIAGLDREALRDKYDNSFYNLLADKYAEYFRTVEIDSDFNLNEQMQMKTAAGLKWILVQGKVTRRKGRIITISAVIVDVDENKKLNDRLAIEQERYRMATELSNDVILSYSVMDDTLNISENFREFYGGATVVNNFSRDKVWEKGFVHQEDIEKVAELVRIIATKGNGIDQQVRIRDISGNYVWCRLICKPIIDKTGEHKEYIGKLINIDMHKKQLGMLEKKAMRDPLTGAFNKEYTKALVNRFISENPGSKGMLLMVDIDRFKNINDTYGHLMGDNIIIEVVRQVTKAFRADDIIGRIGGDEFAVFVCNVNNPEDQIKQARKLHEVLRQPVQIDGQVINKSASIGVALYPDHAADYEKLIECADKALYRVKGSGRDSFIIYDKRDFEKEGEE